MGAKNAAIIFMLYIFNIFTLFWGIIDKEVFSISVRARKFYPCLLEST